tara:strand:+ start:2299 stop:2568 length:270 start_codon:yes stop_codon:yes gene_type:complete
MINVILSISDEEDMDYKSKLINFCRQKEINFRNDLGVVDLKYSHSGLEYLSGFLKDGNITMQEYIAILPAVIRPQTEYKLHKLKTNGTK